MDTSSQSVRPSRRIFRFGLRALFVFVTLIVFATAWLGVQIGRCHREDEALLRLGKTTKIIVSFANPFPSSKETVLGQGKVVPYGGGPKWLADLLGVDIFRTVVLFQSLPQLNRDGTILRLTDADMKWLNDLYYLRELRLEANEITDKGLDELDNLPHIEALALSSTSISDNGLSALPNFPRLRILALRGTKISDAAVNSLCNCRQLEILDLRTTSVTSKGIQTLQKKLPSCKIEH